MGDTGSLTVGMMLCFLSLKLIMCGTDDNAGHINPMVLAFSPLLVPCCDVVRVYLHRVRNGKNPFLPDKNHIYHKLLALGIKQRNAMITIISVSCRFRAQIEADLELLNQIITEDVSDLLTMGDKINIFKRTIV